MFQRLMKLFTNPQEYWSEAIAEPGDIRSQLIPKMALITGASALAGFLGQLFALARISFASGLLVGLFVAVITFVLQIGIWIALGFIIDGLAPSFGAQRDIGQSMKLASGTMIPMLLGLLLGIIPFSFIRILGWLGGLGYGAYVLFLGLPIMNGTAPEKAIGYVAASIGILLVLSLVAGILAGCPASCLVYSVVRGLTRAVP